MRNDTFETSELPAFGLSGGMLGGLVLSLAVALPLAAAPQSVAEIAGYTGADRQSVLEEGAKKERSVLIYTSATQQGPMFEAFNKKYPYVKVETWRGGSPEIARRMLEEYKAQHYVVDAIDTTTGAMHALRDAKAILPFASPELAVIKPDAIEPGRHWALNYESYLSLGYNTKEVSEQDVPRTYEGLLNPRWRGKMAVPGSSSLINWLGAVMVDLGNVEGEKYLRKLGEQKLPLHRIDGRAVANMIVTGESPLSPVIYNSHMANSKSQGASVGWLPIGAVFAQIGSVAIATKAAHPHAAMLYIDFILGRDGQKMMQDAGYASPRTDMNNPDRPERVLYLSERPNYAAEYESWAQLSAQVFGK